MRTNRNTRAGSRNGESETVEPGRSDHAPIREPGRKPPMKEPGTSWPVEEPKPDPAPIREPEIETPRIEPPPVAEVSRGCSVRRTRGFDYLDSSIDEPNRPRGGVIGALRASREAWTVNRPVESHTMPAHSATEITLDPADWDAFRALAHRAVDDMVTYLATVRERPAWQPLSAEALDALRSPLPLEPQGAERAYQDFQRFVLPYPLGNIHPRFWGWVIGTGTPMGALSEYLAATMNPNVGGAEHAAPHVEVQVLDWCKQMLGYPEASSGILVSGGSMANFVGLAVARDARAEVAVGERGLAAAPRPMVLYASSEVHNSVKKAAALLGLGRAGVRVVPVDAAFKIDHGALVEAIRSDRAAGLHPFCVVGNAGTVNTGAVDDLERLADLCRTEDLWFHVDGAFGALAALSPQLRHKVRGMERADSLAFDLHKWMYMPYEAGCVLVRDAAQHRNAFVSPADYLTHATRGTSGGSVWFSDYGMQLSRGFRALKVWMSLKEHGVRRYAQLIEQNAAQAQYLAEQVGHHPDLELMAPVELNIAVFRFRADGLDEQRLNALNETILIDLQERGIAVLTSTMLNGRYAMRAAIVNHRSRREDFDLVVEAVAARGRELLASHI